MHNYTEHNTCNVMYKCIEDELLSTRQISQVSKIQEAQNGFRVSRHAVQHTVHVYAASLTMKTDKNVD